MQYNQPLDQPTNNNAPYVDGNPQAGIQGSIVPAASIEFDQREVVEVVTRANARGYSDFSGAPCAAPTNSDLTQLRKAIEGFITDWQFIIDTEVTYTVHGSGADFTDLIAAFDYLGKYKITPTGHVILKLAGATSGGATQYTYFTPIVANHPNNDRISIVGATMLKPLPLDDSGYASNGYSSAQQAADLTTNLAILRQCFATELHFQSLPPLSAGNSYQCGIWIDGVMLMHLDAILFTGDGTATGMIATCQGYCNGTLVSGVPTISGIAFAQWSNGIIFDAGASVSMQGAGVSQNLWSPIVICGCSNIGMLCENGGFFTTYGNVICLGGGYGFVSFVGSGAQFDGGLFCCSNQGDGANISRCAIYCNGPNQGGTPYGPSHFYKNGGFGLSNFQASGYYYLDCGAGANANHNGSVYATYGSIIVVNDINVSGACSPPFNTIGNSNSLIA